MKICKYILAFDPSGSFHEGKGTTGWCVFNSTNKTVIETGEIHAMSCHSAEEYWQRHVKLIHDTWRTYRHELIIVCEDYLLYANKAESQINSRMETPKLIGVIQQKAFELQIPFILQTASMVVNRWEDKILVFKGILEQKDKRSYCLTDKPNFILSNHTRDSIRHAVHYSYFGKEPK